VAYGYTYKIKLINQTTSTTSSTMLDNLIFRDEDSLPLEWSFISYEELPRTEDNSLKFNVQMNSEQKMIKFNKSTLTMEY